MSASQERSRGRFLAGPAGPASPDSAFGCVGNDPWDNIQTCLNIIGNGSYVEKMYASSIVYLYAVVEHLELSGPSIPHGYINTEDYLVQPGEYIDIPWDPYRDIDPGKYCATSWELNGNGSFTNEGRACETVK